MLDANLDAALRRQLVSIDELVQTAERLATRGPARQDVPSAWPCALEHAGGRGRERARTAPRSFARETRPREAGAAVRDARRRWTFRRPSRPGLSGGRALVVEYDSFEHHVGTAALVRDSARRNAIATVGLTVLTVTPADLRDGADRLAVDRHIRRARRLTKLNAQVASS